MKNAFRIMLTAAVAIIALSFAPSAAAISCGQIVGQPLYDTSDNCDSAPHIDRYFGAEVFSWKDHDYLMVHTGNELAIWNIDQPLLPTLVDESRFNVNNVGDSDYDLLTFSVCDDCRYGTAAFKAGLVLFDFGEGDVPGFSADSFHPEVQTVPGAFTFFHAERQYVIAVGFQEDCDFGSSSIYSYDGLDPQDWVQIGCLASDDVFPLVVDGYYIPGPERSYLYLADRSRRVHVYELTGTDTDLSLSFQGTPTAVGPTRSCPFAVDLDLGLAVTGSPTGLNVWDISLPAVPDLIVEYPSGLSAVAVRPPFVYAARVGSADTSRFFYLSETNRLVPFDAEFWAEGQWWNDYDCERPYESVFSPDGTALYLARFSVLQVVSMEDCFDVFMPALDPEIADD